VAIEYAKKDQSENEISETRPLKKRLFKPKKEAHSKKKLSLGKK
jgi:hypothetical protein